MLSIKVNRYTVKGSNYVIFSIFASLNNGSQLFKERIWSSRSRFFLSRVGTILEGLLLKGKQPATFVITKAVSLCKKRQKNMEIYPFVLMSHYLSWFCPSNQYSCIFPFLYINTCFFIFIVLSSKHRYLMDKICRP